MWLSCVKFGQVYFDFIFLSFVFIDEFKVGQVYFDFIFNKCLNIFYMVICGKKNVLDCCLYIFLWILIY